MLLALAYIFTWSVMAFFLAKFLIFAESVAPHDWIMFCLSLFGVVSCFFWIVFGNRWRSALITTSVLYLILYFLRFYEHLQFTPKVSFWQDISFVFSSVWTLSVYAFSRGWVLSGIEILFYDWIMPSLQIVFLVALVVFNPSFNRELKTHS